MYGRVRATTLSMNSGHCKWSSAILILVIANLFTPLLRYSENIRSFVTVSACVIHMLYIPQQYIPKQNSLDFKVCFAHK